MALAPGSADLRAQLVGVPARELPSLPLVDGRGGDEALARSWLWQKLTAAAAADGSLLAQAAWGEPSVCAVQAAAPTPYGARMPQSGTATSLADARLSALQRWICAGAPGPRAAP